MSTFYYHVDDLAVIQQILKNIFSMSLFDAERKPFIISDTVQEMILCCTIRAG
jgi:hypothetical protein